MKKIIGGLLLGAILAIGVIGIVHHRHDIGAFFKNIFVQEQVEQTEEEKEAIGLPAPQPEPTPLEPSTEEN